MGVMIVAQPYEPGQFGGDRWGLAKESDRRFRRMATALCLLMLAVALWSRLLPAVDVPPVDDTPVATVVELLLEPADAPVVPVPAERFPVAKELAVIKEPAVDEVQPAEPIQTPVSLPPEAPPSEEMIAKHETPAAVEPTPKSAREQAQETGLLAMRQQLLALRNADSILSSASGRLRDDAPLAERGLQTPKVDESAFSAEAVRRSAGSQQLHADRIAGPASTSRLASHVAKSEIQRQLPSGVSGSRGVVGAAAARPSRSLEEIQLAFDRNKNAFSAIFSRAARSNDEIDSGAIIVSLTISPSGDVVDCRLVSSSFEDPGLHQRILTRVKMLQFEPRDVPQYTYPNYPINYVRS